MILSSNYLSCNGAAVDDANGLGEGADAVVRKAPVLTVALKATLSSRVSMLSNLWASL